MVLRGTTDEMMLNAIYTQTFLAEAATAASALPCGHSVDPTRQPGNLIALDERHAI